MPKIKTNRAAAKRFKKTGTGKLKRNKAYKSYRADSENRKRDSLKAAGFGQEGSCGGNLLCGNTEQNVVLSHE